MVWAVEEWVVLDEKRRFSRWNRPITSSGSRGAWWLEVTDLTECGDMWWSSVLGSDGCGLDLGEGWVSGGVSIAIGGFRLDGVWRFVVVIDFELCSGMVLTSVKDGFRVVFLWQWVYSVQAHSLGVGGDMIVGNSGNQPVEASYPFMFVFLLFLNA